MNRFFGISFLVLILNGALLTNFVQSSNTDFNLYLFLKHLDVSSLSRLLSFKHYIGDHNYVVRPDFGPAFLYHDKGVTGWTMRLGMYGYGIVGLPMRGDGNCMFYTLCSIFKLNKIDNKRLLEYMNPDLQPAVKIAIIGMLQEEEYISPINLKRLAQIYYVGMDPYDEDSVALYNKEEFLLRAKDQVDLQEAFQTQVMPLDSGSMLHNIDIKTQYNKIAASGSGIEAVRELFDKFDEKIYTRHGDHTDKRFLERIFQMRMLYFNRQNTRINCGNKELDFNTKLVLTMLYEDGCHFDIAGIYKLGTTDLKDVKSAYNISEIPLPLLLMITEDYISHIVEAVNPITSTFPYRIDTPRRIANLFSPYKLHEDLTSSHICPKFSNWSPTSKEWDNKLNPYNLTLCSRDYGGDGNCLFYVIAGILKDNGYNIGKFDLERRDISPGIRISLKGMKFSDDGFFSMKDIRRLSSLAYVGIDPENPEAQQYLDVEQLRSKIQLTIAGMDMMCDITWGPSDCLKKLNEKKQQPIEVAKYVYKSIASSSPVKNWGSGDDLYGLCEILNVDFLLFHKDGAKIQHFKSSLKRPVCTLNIYYYHMTHFQSAGVVVNYMNSNRRKLSSLYKNFELDEELFKVLATSNESS
ncbi:conserved hypothetical protein [Theileria orientalis strain Shintoku]|uniref:OTU domain-containing protein n=1 Tax=Theileria orientalis strain Shintoku TaxID=869250 RepID=J4DQ64_THEOR|nr:conserved hypothetical protein [Theileria orientalis strain Shintoku]PVC51342.1 hypothetical protein MACL_00001606 [Theileria orientalis]BAM41909.1 conserved hypothetical protein [Theileria orientalis strain Shintoku]|eukprot:XP_009692210.1 conserved hypothetical protein [Theileria orientalis strain Shintoku]